jgi:hypothetical protein
LIWHTADQFGVDCANCCTADHQDSEEDEDKGGSKEDKIKTTPKITGSIHTHFLKASELHRDYTE